MEAEKIIKQARRSMQDMLTSVYRYNSSFPLNKNQEKLLERVLFAMSVIDRKYFAPKDYYLDTALGIGSGQTISQPSTVARMLLLADLKQGDDFLEIGTGSGWNASLAAFLVYPGNVVSIERINALKEKALGNLNNIRDFLKEKKPEIYTKLKKINFIAENIFVEGKAWKKKYDKIMFTAGIEDEDEIKMEKIANSLLKDKGILICPHMSGPLLIYKKEKGKIIRTLTKESYVFVPLLE